MYICPGKPRRHASLDMGSPFVPITHVQGDPQNDEFGIAVPEIAAGNRVIANIPPRPEQRRVIGQQAVHREWGRLLDLPSFA